MKLIFATNNQHKIEEVSKVIGSGFQLLTMEQTGINTEIPEPYDTIKENASAKSKTIFSMTGHNCFSEDTGLEVEALNGEPGVHSARYAGESRSSDDNIKKLLKNLEPHKNRQARFLTIISLILNGKEFFFDGICNGQILYSPKGTGGFGYDPVFVPDGETRSFGEMSLEEKTYFSHRRKATDKLVTFLQNLEIKATD